MNRVIGDLESCTPGIRKLYRFTARVFQVTHAIAVAAYQVMVVRGVGVVSLRLGNRSAGYRMISRRYRTIF